MAENLLEITNGNFKTEVLESKIPVIIDFWAEWCMPCKMIAPVVDELANDYKGKIKFAKADVDTNPELATALQILSIPVLIIFKNGKETKRITGANPKGYLQKEIEEALK